MKGKSDTRTESLPGDVGAPMAFWLPEVGGRKCVPVRLLPYATEWWPLSPDKIAELFGIGEVIGRGRRWQIKSYALHEGNSYRPVLQRTWANVADRLYALQSELGSNEHDLARNLVEWERRSILLMPEAVFVWRDELEAEFGRFYGRYKFLRPRPGSDEPSDEEVGAELSRQIESMNAMAEAEPDDHIPELSLPNTMEVEGDGSLNFEPVLSAAERAAVFAGFEPLMPESGCPTSSLDGGAVGQRATTGPLSERRHPDGEDAAPPKLSPPTNPSVVKPAPWIELARKEARGIIKEREAKDLYPSQLEIADEIAARFRSRHIMGTADKPLAGETIKRHALKGISSAKKRARATTLTRGKWGNAPARRALPRETKR